MQRYLFLADTPIQVYYSILICKSIGKKHCDIIIINQFKGAKELTERLNEASIFNNITLVDKKKSNIVRGKINSIIGLFFPNYYLKNNCSLYLKNIERYDFIYLSYATKIYDFIIYMLSKDNTEIIGYEDGIGTYIMDTFSTSGSSVYRFLWSLRLKGKKVKKLYLTNPDFYDCKKFELYKIKTNNISDSNELKQIFGVSNLKKDDEYDILFFNQPLSDFDYTHKQIECKIIDILKKSTDRNVKVRLHPREKDDEIYSGIEKDEIQGLWEIISESKVNDKTVLISCSSTAALMPNMLYGIEPNIIFLYKLYPDISNEKVESYDRLVEMIRKSYNDKNKIAVPERLDEISSMLKEKMLS